MKLLFSSILIAIFSFQAVAQLKIAPGTTMASAPGTEITTNASFFNEGELVLGNNTTLSIVGQGVIESINSIEIPQLIMSGSSYSLSGQWIISKALSLQSGTITPDASAQLTVGPGGTVIAENGAYVNGTLFHTGTGEKFYPIGVAGTYAPVTLHSVQGAGDLLLGIQAHTGSLGETTLPNNVQSASSNWHWEMHILGTFSGSTVTLPVLAGDEALLEGGNTQPVVLESNSDLTLITDLGNGLASDKTLVRSNKPAVGPFLLLGSKLILVPIIHNIITPNGDEKNDYLIIDAVEAYADSNEVIILDRWGNEVYRQENFRNFNAFDNPYDNSFDFLASGNYICILKYGNGQTLKQTITVLK
ncbi:hypothetical protein C900_01791 [Fulvivirga imtechensis AK7]|uniref:Gliding motility-associated C-terminal domain-containing protein n=1 Tax=Fulvivirga imtechensis AK7 TaxID=1237149 RepID=L8JYH1_9BACT|nr:gliding motility-associated C-terminal domain-containing protein [Fulvivirga imtechensis]ELR72237.1 hypothetical protein C900_01791 [Fulvivirga imtechensis AK7]